MFEMAHALVLGSGSPRRRELLEQLGFNVLVDPPQVDESGRGGETPLAYVRRIARQKLITTQERWNGVETPFSGILCADTIVCVQGEVLQKPSSVGEAEEMLTRLMGRQHEVMTGYALWAGDNNQTVERVITTRVNFRHAQQHEISSYAQSGEGLDKAGAYAIQGKGAVFVEQVQGSYSNVVGLPLCELFLDLRQLGIAKIVGEPLT